jgi:MFS family permease
MATRQLAASNQAEHFASRSVGVEEATHGRSARFSFVAASLSFVAIFTASASPIPLYEIYHRTSGVTKADLSLTAVAYFAAAVTALLLFGRLSNHLGRRHVSVAALLVTASGCVVLTDVHGPALLILGRILQGLGAGLASSAIAAYIVDTRPRSPRWLAAAVATGAPMIGLTLGALGSGALVQYAPHPRSLVYLIATAFLTLCALLVTASRETVVRTRGTIMSLRPQAHIPAATRPFLPVAAATFVATWALGGFYQAFGPTIAADQLGTTNTLVAAVVFASLMVPSAIGAPLSGHLSPAAAQRLGMGAFLLAVLTLLASLRLGAIAPFLIASAIAGAAQGATFAGSLRALLAETSPAERAGLLAIVYATAYSGAAIPAVIAGQLARTLSLFQIALGYGALAALACAITLAAATNPGGRASLRTQQEQVRDRQAREH